MKRIFVVFIGALLGVSCVVGLLYLVLDHTSLVPNPAAPLPAGRSDSAALPQVIATVNGVAITRQMVDTEVKVSRLNVVAPMPALSGADLERAQEEALNQLINRQLILQAAARQNFRLTDEFVLKRVDLLFGTKGADALDEALAQIGATRADVAWWVREIFTVEEFTTKVVMAEAAPEERQQVYNDWLNAQRAAADIKNHLNGEAQALLALVGEPAPEFALQTTDNRPVALSDYRGKVVLVNFWATWCPSCVVEMPDYEQVYQQHGRGEGDFVVLGVNLQEGGAYAAEYAAGLGLTFPILLDQDGRVTTRQYQATGMPASFIIDRQGLIFYRHLGPMSGDTLEAKLAELGL